MSPAKLIDGAEHAANLRSQTLQRARSFFQGRGRRPRPDVIIVGDRPASRSYVSTKTKQAADTEIDGRLIELPESIDQRALLEEIRQLNAAGDVHRGQDRSGADAYPVHPIGIAADARGEDTKDRMASGGVQSQVVFEALPTGSPAIIRIRETGNRVCRLYRVFRPAGAIMESCPSLVSSPYAILGLRRAWESTRRSSSTPRDLPLLHPA